MRNEIQLGLIVHLVHGGAKRLKLCISRDCVARSLPSRAALNDEGVLGCLAELVRYAPEDATLAANLLGDAIESGMVGINTFAVSAVDAPFGGVKDSGFGSEGGVEGMDGYLVTKAVHQA